MDVPRCLKTILSSRKKRLGDVSAYIRTLLVSIDRIDWLSQECVSCGVRLDHLSLAHGQTIYAGARVLKSMTTAALVTTHDSLSLTQ